MFRKLTIFFAALVTVLAFAPAANAAVGAAPAQAGLAAASLLAPEVAGADGDVGIQDTSCASGYLCFWVHADYRGARGRFAGNNTHWSSYPQSQCQSGNWNDCASSAKNRGTQCRAHLHEHSSFGGARHSIGRGGNRAHLSNHDFNDRTSSNSWC